MYTVKKISELTGISSYTLRFYDNQGLFPFVVRDKNNIRLFSDAHLDWINLIHCLRDTGMSILDIKEYLKLCEQGKSTAEERYSLILRQKEIAEQEVIRMQERVELLKKKTDYYKIMSENSDGDFWNPVNCAEISKKNRKN